MTAPLIGWREARTEAHHAGALLASASSASERLPLAEAVGRTLAADLLAPGNVPGHDGSAMDGWAVAGEGPWRIGAPIVTGSAPETAMLEAGIARPITTGAPVPPGTAAVIRTEDGEVRTDGEVRRDGEVRPDAGDRCILVRRGDASTRRHIRSSGEEVRIGQLLFAAGQTLTPPRVALAAASGVDEAVVAVAPRVRLGVLGDEIVGHGVPAPGQVRDVFSGTFPSILHSLGAEPVETVRVADDLDATVRALRGQHAASGARAGGTARPSDGDAQPLRLVITTGGTARSSSDHVRAALTQLGAELVLDRVDIRPGRPVLLARRGDTLHLCLPGNPMAAMVGLVTFGIPLIDGLLGRPLAIPGAVVLGDDVSSDRPGHLILAYRTTAGGALPASHQTSAMLRGLAAADGLMIIAPGGRQRDENVPALTLPW